MRTHSRQARLRKARIKRGWCFVAGIIVGAALMGVRANVQQENMERENRMVHEYVECLEDNWTQRDYCAREIGSNYHHMDYLVEKHGYVYTQVGYDLYIDWKGGDE